MTPWDLIKYMYLLSVISMGMYILQNKDSFLISYGLQKKDGEDNNFVFSMMMTIIFSPVVWMMMYIDRNGKGKK